MVPVPPTAGLKLAPNTPGPLQLPRLLEVTGSKLTGELVLHWSEMLEVITAGTYASTLMDLVCEELQVLVPITYCTMLRPTGLNDGVNKPDWVRYEVAVQIPVLGVTVS